MQISYNDLQNQLIIHASELLKPGDGCLISGYFFLFELFEIQVLPGEKRWMLQTNYKITFFFVVFCLHHQ